MGWDFTEGWTKKDVVADCIRGSETDLLKVECLGHKVNGRTLWAVMASTDKLSGVTTKWIACILLDSDPGFGWGCKKMEEAMHPYNYDCPLQYLEMVPEVANEEWRAKVREYHAEKASKTA